MENKVWDKIMPKVLYRWELYEIGEGNYSEKCERKKKTLEQKKNSK